MREADLPEFSGMLDAICSMLSRGNYTPSVPNTAMWFRALSQYNIDEIRAGFDSHVKDPQRGRFVPVPADVIAQIGDLAADDGRPGAEEAWAASLQAEDESRTVVWSHEMAQAWAIARPVLDGGDKVGARMAFKEAYTRLVDEARRVRRSAVWTPSLGFDAAGRTEALQAAAAAGRLPVPDVLALPAPTEAFEAIAAHAPAGVLEALKALRHRLTRRYDEPSVDALARQRTADLKAEAAQAVAEYEERIA